MEAEKVRIFEIGRNREYRPDDLRSARKCLNARREVLGNESRSGSQTTVSRRRRCKGTDP
jgi:hypothetical protein